MSGQFFVKTASGGKIGSPVHGDGRREAVACQQASESVVGREMPEAVLGIKELDFRIDEFAFRFGFQNGHAFFDVIRQDEVV